MKLTDCLAKILRKYKINHTFGLQGGAVVHIFDSLEKYGIKIVYTLHEQAAALAAASNAKVNNKFCNSPFRFSLSENIREIW